MFTKAIEEVSQFTRPLQTISRTYGGMITPSVSSLFFVNDEGVAVTSKAMGLMLYESVEMNNKFEKFKQKVNSFQKDSKFRGKLTALESQYKFKGETIVQRMHNFPYSKENRVNLNYHFHPTLDIAIVVFDGVTIQQYGSHAVFVKDSAEKIKHGRTLCRFGFAGAEFNNFRINPDTNDLEWTNTGANYFSSFAIDGMISRFLMMNRQEGDTVIAGIEMSTPALKSHVGCPLFDADGLIYGMQINVMHHHMDYDIKNADIIIDGKKTKISDIPLFHTGICIHAERIKEFLKEKNIRFYEA